MDLVRQQMSKMAEEIGRLKETEVMGESTEARRSDHQVEVRPTGAERRRAGSWQFSLPGDDMLLSTANQVVANQMKALARGETTDMPKVTAGRNPVDAVRQRMALNMLRLYNWIAIEGGFTASKRKEMTRQKFTNVIATLRPSPTLTDIMGKLFDDVQDVANLPHCGDLTPPVREGQEIGLKITNPVARPEPPDPRRMQRECGKVYIEALVPLNEARAWVDKGWNPPEGWPDAVVTTLTDPTVRLSYGGVTKAQRKMGLRSTKFVDGPEANTDWD